MNLAQTIHTKASEAAARLPFDLSQHELATSELEAFKADQIDPLDYPEWLVAFRAKRAQIKSAAEEEAQKLTQLGKRSTVSELQAAAEKVAAASEAQKKA